MCIWGNHSATQYPDAWNGTVDKDGKTVKATEAVNNDEWLKSEFITTVQVYLKIPIRNNIFKLSNSRFQTLNFAESSIYSTLSYKVQSDRRILKNRFLVFYRYFWKNENSPFQCVAETFSQTPIFILSVFQNHTRHFDMIFEFCYRNDLTPNYPENRPTFTFCFKRHSLIAFIFIFFLRNEVRLFWLLENSLRLCRRLRLSETIWEIGLMAQMVAGCLWRLTRPETNIMSQRVLFIPSQSPVKVS